MTFQSTRPRGARHIRIIVCKQRAMFQSTRPRGARPRPAVEVVAVRQVSIHAPTGGATNTRARWGAMAGVSIHAPTGGATRRGKRPPSWSWFQSTRPRGARPLFSACSASFFCFNPRAHGGRDCREDVAFHIIKVSIHAPTGGATGDQRRGCERAGVSIHAPTGGATR